MIPERTTSLAAYVEELASSGRISFTREDAMEALGVNHGAFLDAAAYSVHHFDQATGFPHQPKK